MASQINASNSGFGGIVSTGDSSGVLQLQTVGTTAVTIDTSQNTTLAGKLTTASSGIQFSDASIQTAAASPYVLKNRIINGAMVIDQRYAGAATANSINDYTVDRWSVLQSVIGKLIAQQNAAAVTPPTGFSYYLGVTSQSSYSVLTGDYYMIRQPIEGYNVADLGFGTANAKTVTLSFWVRSSLTGTFGGSLRNSAGDRNYPFTYTISVANTWELKSVTIAGDTTGTWLTTNGIGLIVQFGLGVGSTYSGAAGAWTSTLLVSATGAVSVVGTNGATFYITGVQLEIGSTATPFERRLYNQELANCQRYCYVDTGANCFVGGAAANSTNMYIKYVLPVPMRGTPTLSFVSSGANQLVMSDQYVADFAATTPTVATAPNVANHSGRVQLGGFTGLTTGRWYGGAPNTSAQSIFSAEL